MRTTFFQLTLNLSVENMSFDFTLNSSIEKTSSNFTLNSSFQQTRFTWNPMHNKLSQFQKQFREDDFLINIFKKCCTSIEKPNNYPHELLQQLHQLHQCYQFLSCTQPFSPSTKNQCLSILLFLSLYFILFFVISCCKQPCNFFSAKKARTTTKPHFFFICFQLSNLSTSYSFKRLKVHQGAKQSQSLR